MTVLRLAHPIELAVALRSRVRRRSRQAGDGGGPDSRRPSLAARGQAGLDRAAFAPCSGYRFTASRCSSVGTSRPRVGAGLARRVDARDRLGRRRHRSRRSCDAPASIGPRAHRVRLQGSKGDERPLPRPAVPVRDGPDYQAPPPCGSRRCGTVSGELSVARAGGGTLRPLVPGRPAPYGRRRSAGSRKGG